MIARPVVRTARRLTFWVAGAGLFLTGLAALHAQAPAPTPAPAVVDADARAAKELQLRVADLKQLGGVLHVGAHPDDENTQLITYLARGRRVRAAYLSLTRGDGGQNVLGGELGEKLGLARTLELMAARDIDGGHQLFTRAVDFGFSKDVNETLQNWDREAVVQDIIRVIRTFRPDVIVTRFAPEPGGTHGHHTASAVLALEAFKRAGDPNETASGLPPWQPTRIFQNIGFGAGKEAQLKVDIGGTDPVSGEPFGTLAARSRAMHKTQGFDGFNRGAGAGPREESFRLLDGTPATQDFFDGITTSWARYPGGAEIDRQIDQLVARYDTASPAERAAALLALRRALAPLPADPLVAAKRLDLDRLIADTLGVAFVATTPSARVAPGDALPVSYAVQVPAGVSVASVTLHPADDTVASVTRLPAASGPWQTVNTTIPADAPLTQPYWLVLDQVGGMSRVTDPRRIGAPLNPPAIVAQIELRVGEETLRLQDAVIVRDPAAPPAQRDRPVAIVAPAHLEFGSDVALLAPGQTRNVSLTIASDRPGLAGDVSLTLPPGWTATPAAQHIVTGAPDGRTTVTFALTAPATTSTGKVGASLRLGSRAYAQGYLDYGYTHLPRMVLQPDARMIATSADVKLSAKAIGYLPGAGDSIADNLAQLGCTVTTLDTADLTPANLGRFDAIIVGVRAFNVRNDLPTAVPALLAYVEAGGVVVANYNRPGRDLRVTDFAPFPLTVGGGRVTDERSPFTILSGDHPAFNRPNAIAATDFAGWVQERGAYFPDKWDERFTPLLGLTDPGEARQDGALLVARHGKGYYVYTSLAFFRQLPAGVPGAYRLMANLLSLGQ